jgi:hypothetical protein
MRQRALTEAYLPSAAAPLAADRDLAGDREKAASC